MNKLVQALAQVARVEKYDKLHDERGKSCNAARPGFTELAYCGEAVKGAYAFGKFAVDADSKQDFTMIHKLQAFFHCARKE